MKTALAAMFVLGVFAADPSGSASPPVLIKRDIPYGPLPAQTLTTCSPDVSNGKPRAGVVLIHGGAWFAFDKTTLQSNCEALAREGLFAATIDYRLVRPDQPDTRWPAQLADVQLAVRWLRANAASLGLDGSRLCAYGDSAGGHLAVFLAAKKTIEPSDMADRLADQPVSVACAVDNFGPVDLTDPGAALQGKVEHLLGKRLTAATKAAFVEASPLYLIDKDTAPIFIEHGSSDTVVPFTQSAKLFDTLTARKVAARFTSFDGDHTWKGLPPADQGLLAAEERQFLRLSLDGASRRVGG